MKKIVFGLILGSVALISCSPRNYFLFNSDMVAKYDRVNGKWELIWNTSMKHLSPSPDTIPTHFKEDSVICNQ